MLEMFKRAAGVVVGLGIGQIVTAVVNNNVAPKSMANRITLTAGSYVLGCMLADAGRKYAAEKIDEIAVWVDDHMTDRD